MEHNYYLAHYGVKGMKWRRRKSTYNNETFEDRFRRESLEIEKNQKRIKDNIDKERFNKKWNEGEAFRQIMIKSSDVILNSADTIPLIKKGKDLFNLNTKIVTGLMATTINTAKRALFNFFKRR